VPTPFEYDCIPGDRPAHQFFANISMVFLVFQFLKRFYYFSRWLWGQILVIRFYSVIYSNLEWNVDTYDF
jgi:hypothetical protein